MFLISIDRDNHTPLYIQIYQQIKFNIYNRQLKHNEKLISEKQFAELYDVSNFIVKRAYKMLEDEDLVKKIKGKGVFVNYRKTIEIDLSNKVEIPLPISGLYDYRMIYHTRIKDASYLNREWDNHHDEVELFRILVTYKDMPIAFAELFVSQKLNFSFHRFIQSKKHLNAYFEETFQLPIEQTSTINAARADEILIEALNIEPSCLTTLARTIFKSQKLGNFCYTKTYYVAKHTLLKVSDL